MVGGDGVDRAVAQAFDNREAIFLGAQRRVHFAEGAIFEHRFIGQRKVMRRGFGRYFQPFFLGAAHGFHRFRRGNMQHVVLRTGKFSQNNIALDDDRFRRIRHTAHTQLRGNFSFIHAGSARKV